MRAIGLWDVPPPRRCCRERMLGPELGEGRIPRVREVPCAAVVTISLTFKPDGTLPTLEEARALAAARAPSPRRVFLPVWTS